MRASESGGGRKRLQRRRFLCPAPQNMQRFHLALEPLPARLQFQRTVEVSQRRLVGVVMARAPSRCIQIVQGAVAHLGRGQITVQEVVRQPFDCFRLLDCQGLGYGHMQFVLLRFQQRPVDDLLGDVMFEDIDRPWLWGFHPGEIASLEQAKLFD